MNQHIRSAALISALLVASAGSAWAQPATAAGGEGARHAAHHHMGKGKGMGDGAAMAERALDAVGASAEQKTRVREIFRSARDDMSQQRTESSALRQQMQALMAAPQIDAAAAEVLRQQQMAKHDVSSRRMMQAMLDAAAVLTPEQRQKLSERMNQRGEMQKRHQRERRALETPRS